MPVSFAFLCSFASKKKHWQRELQQFFLFLFGFFLSTKVSCRGAALIMVYHGKKTERMRRKTRDNIIGDWEDVGASCAACWSCFAYSELIRLSVNLYIWQHCYLVLVWMVCGFHLNVLVYKKMVIHLFVVCLCHGKKGYIETEEKPLKESHTVR